VNDSEGGAVPAKRGFFFSFFGPLANDSARALFFSARLWSGVERATFFSFLG